MAEPIRHYTPAEEYPQGGRTDNARTRRACEFFSPLAAAAPRAGMRRSDRLVQDLFAWLLFPGEECTGVSPLFVV